MQLTDQRTNYFVLVETNYFVGDESYNYYLVNACGTFYKNVVHYYTMIEATDLTEGQEHTVKSVKGKFIEDEVLKFSIEELEKILPNAAHLVQLGNVFIDATFEEWQELCKKCTKRPNYIELCPSGLVFY